MNKEIIERELARRQKYEELMKERFNRFLEAQNIDMVRDGGYAFTLKYKGTEFGLMSNNDWNSWNKHYQVWVGDKTLATRCGLEVAIAKAQSYIERKGE